MSFSLIPTSFLIYMKGRTKIAVVFSACFFCTILCMVVCGVFNNPATSVIIFAAAIILIAICLYPGIINNKIVSSKVEFSVEGIEVIDKKGCCLGGSQRCRGFLFGRLRLGRCRLRLRGCRFRSFGCSRCRFRGYRAGGLGLYGAGFLRRCGCRLGRLRGG